jgi:hypothetical protein
MDVSQPAFSSFASQVHINAWRIGGISLVTLSLLRRELLFLWVYTVGLSATYRLSTGRTFDSHGLAYVVWTLLGAHGCQSFLLSSGSRVSFQSLLLLHLVFSVLLLSALLWIFMTCTR